jgi:hypothetical protein
MLRIGSASGSMSGLQAKIDQSLFQVSMPPLPITGGQRFYGLSPLIVSQ